MMKTWILMCTALSLSAFVPGQATPNESPFACNRAALTDTGRKRHFDELGPALRLIVKTVRELRDGYAFQFPSDPATFRLVAEWAAGEHLCCPFLDIELRQERENGAFWLRLAGRPGAKQFIEDDLGKWMRSEHGS
jgi:hypothetical protein